MFQLTKRKLLNTLLSFALVFLFSQSVFAQDMEPNLDELNQIAQELSNESTIQTAHQIIELFFRAFPAEQDEVAVRVQREISIIQFFIRRRCLTQKHASSTLLYRYRRSLRPSRQSLA